MNIVWAVRSDPVVHPGDGKGGKTGLVFKQRRELSNGGGGVRIMPTDRRVGSRIEGDRAVSA